MSFTFRQFHIDDSRCGMKVSTDSVVLGSWVDVTDVTTILDIGAGCGLLSLMMAQRCPQACITAVEIDADAARQCAENVAASSFADRIATYCDDIFNRPRRQYDLIICNPPFFTETLRSPDGARSGARHEGALGVESLIRLAADCLTADGSLAFVAPCSRDSEIELMLSLAGLGCGRTMQMRQRAERPPVRTFRQATRHGRRFATSELIVNLADGTRTPQYSALTSHFYL